MSQQKTILLIEDNLDVRENTAEILELANYHVWTAANGKEGVALAKQHLPDLIICDIMMPELDGYGVLHILSHDQKTAVIPFIFLTAKTEKSDFRKGMNMGADDYITKPFEELDLLDTIRRRLAKSSLLGQQNIDLEESTKHLFRPKQAVKALQELKDEQKRLSVDSKYMLFHEDSYPCYLYFLRKGKVKIYKTNEDGKELITELYKAGEYFGYRSLFGNGKYGGSAMTLEESEIVLIHKEPFLKLIQDNTQVSRFFIKLLANRVQTQGQRLLHLAYDSVRTRVADALLFFCEKYESGHNVAQERISMEISREDLANWVGTSKETLIRTLSDFKHEGLIIAKGRFITVIDKKGLQKIVTK